MTRLLPFLLFSCLLPAALSSPERGPPVDTLDEDVLFEISWPGSTMATIAGFGESLMEPQDHLRDSREEPQEEGAVAVEELPNSLLLSGWEEHPTSTGPIVMTTPNHERYKCVLPQRAEESREEQDPEDLLLLPEALLAPLMDQCTKLVMGYWIYELCHGQHLRQYHEDKNAPEGKKLTEYYLGNTAASAPPTAAEGEPGRGGATGEVKAGHQEKGKEVPVWHFNGQDYPYYAMEMPGGTPCDLLNSDPRSTQITYICEPMAHSTGSFLHIEEVTTCKYLAVVATAQLCENEAYTLKESPVHTIQCYPEKDAPRRPWILLEHELMFLYAKQSSQKPTDSPPLKVTKEETQQQTKQSTVIDTSYIESFLKGDMCLRGGSGWWQHEVCFKQYVKQLHFESSKAKDEVLLGRWDEAAHREWFSKAGKKRQSQNHVTHMYTGGDICDITHTARTCQVRFKCINKGKASGIALYLEEPTPCSYSLTVEGSFVCSLLETMDEFGVFHFRSQESQVSDTDAVDRDSDTDSLDEGLN